MIPLSLIEEAIEEYHSLVADNTVMNISHPSHKIITKLLPYIKQAAGKDNIMHAGGNYYKHNFPYLPHTDYEGEKGNTINVVIPLWKDVEVEPFLVVFDQIYHGYFPVTWMMHHPVYTLSYHTALKGTPSEYNLEGTTDEPIDNELYQHVTHFHKNHLHGLTGNAYAFEPGSCIVFDNRQVHCTSNFKGEKLGLSLRFKEV